MRKHKIGGNQRVKKYFACDKLLYERTIFKVENEFYVWADASDYKSKTCIYPKVVAKMIYYK